MKTLPEVATEIERVLAPLPEGYSVTTDVGSGSVLVCCKYPEPDGLGFAVTAKNIADHDDFEWVSDVFADLIREVDKARANANA